MLQDQAMTADASTDTTLQRTVGRPLTLGRGVRTPASWERYRRE